MSEQKNQLYEVFTRSQRGDYLQHIGTVEASSDAMAKVHAKLIYDEESWAAMCVVKRDDLKWVIETTGLFEQGRRKVNV